MRFHLCAALVALTAAAPAFADSAMSRKILEEQLHSEQARLAELEGMARHDQEMAREIDRLVAVRNRFADEAEAKARRMRAELAGNWPHNSVADQWRAALTRFAQTSEEFARHDRQQATQRKQAETILADQAREAGQGIANHRRYIAEIEAKLGALK